MFRGMRAARVRREASLSARSPFRKSSPFRSCADCAVLRIWLPTRSRVSRPERGA